MTLKLVASSAGSVAGKMDCRSPRAFAFVDYGCADGGNSVELVRAVVNAVQDGAPLEGASGTSARPVCVYMNDLPSAKWAAVTKNMSGLMADYRQQFMLYLCPRSFFVSVMPDDSVDLAYSSASMHWLSRPLQLRSSLYGAEADASERAEWKSQAARDWQTLLALRTRELRVGGRLVVALGAESDDGQYAYKEICGMLYSAARRLVGAGIIAESECQRMAIPAATRTYREIQQPFCVDADGAMEYRDGAGRRLRCIEMQPPVCVPDTYFAAADGNVHAYADAVVKAVRAWSEAHFESALDHETHDEQTRSAILTLLFAMLHSEIVSMQPMCPLSQYFVVQVVCERVA